MTPCLTIARQPWEHVDLLGREAPRAVCRRANDDCRRITKYIPGPPRDRTSMKFGEGFSLGEEMVCNSRHYALRAICFSTQLRKYSSDNSKPSRGLTFGCQPSRFLALRISGRRRVGSSWGSGLKEMLLLTPVTFNISAAHSRIVHSSGLPI